jgi:hypothetical protein
MFFERAPDRAVARAIDDAEFHHWSPTTARSSVHVPWAVWSGPKAIGLTSFPPSKIRGAARLLAVQQRCQALLHRLLARAPMISLSLHPTPVSEMSAFNKMYACRQRPPRRAVPLLITVSSCWRPSLLNLTTYFFTEIPLAAFLPPSP